MLIELHEKDFYYIKKDLMWLECSLGFITDCVDCVYVLPFPKYCDIYLTDVMLPFEGAKLLSKAISLREPFSITIRQTNQANINFDCKFSEKEGEQLLPNGVLFTWLKFVGTKK